MFIETEYSLESFPLNLCSHKDGCDGFNSSNFKVFSY